MAFPFAEIYFRIYLLTWHFLLQGLLMWHPPPPPPRPLIFFSTHFFFACVVCRDKFSSQITISSEEFHFSMLS